MMGDKTGYHKNVYICECILVCKFNQITFFFKENKQFYIGLSDLCSMYLYLPSLVVSYNKTILKPYTVCAVIGKRHTKHVIKWYQMIPCIAVYKNRIWLLSPHSIFAPTRICNERPKLINITNDNFFGIWNSKLTFKVILPLNESI